MTTTIKKARSVGSRQAFFHNPYPFYEQLRASHPVYRGTLLKYSGWFVTGYDEALAILKDTRFHSRIPIPTTSKKYAQLKDVQSNMMLFKNQPDHRRMRTQINQVFTPKMVENLRPLIEETANELLDQMKGKESIDVVSDYAFPLASFIIAHIIGVPTEDRQHFRQWAAKLIQTIDFTRSRKVLEDGNQMITSLSDYFKEIINKRKKHPKDDLISLLLKDRGKDGSFSDQELIATCILLVIAGHETTVNLISNAILALIHHPDQLQLLREKPTLIDSAVEEFLRYESPTQMTARVASENIKVGDVTIEKGEHVYILLGAANRDPRKFTDATSLQITRKPNRHLAFGHGAHFCLGAPLSRLEAQIAIQSLIEKVENLELVSSELEWRKLVGFRALEELRIKI